MTRDWRPFIYGGLDLVFAVTFFVLFTKVAPSNHAGTQAIAYGMAALYGVMGVGMMVRQRWSWWLGAAGCSAILLAAVYLLAQTLHTAAFLTGVYGAFGQGAASLALLGAALIVGFLGLFPSLQLKFLMTRAGRRSFGLAPVWRQA